MTITATQAAAKFAALTDRGAIILSDYHWHAEGELCGTDPTTFKSCSSEGIGVQDFVRLFKHATALTHADLVAENDRVRDTDADGVPLATVKETRANAKGLRKYLDEWKAKGILAP